MTGINWRLSPWFGVMYYGICPDEKSWDEERLLTLNSTHIDIEEFPNSGMTKNYKSERGHCTLVTLKQDVSEIELLGILVHECYHVMANILERMDEDEPGEETVAYMLEGIFKELLEDWNKAKKK